MTSSEGLHTDPSDRLPGELYLAAKRVMANAYAPYSHFPVGAALVANDGRIYAGCNVENASYPEGWCAETSAIAQMIAAGQKQITAMAVIAAERPATVPCGGCRQRIAEFSGGSTLIYLCDGNGIVETVTLGDLLPRCFEWDRGP